MNDKPHTILLKRVCAAMVGLLIISLIHGAAGAVEEVTTQTLNDPQALAELEEKGTVFFSEGFENGNFL
ncbi:MAG: hypothetical protein PVF86_18300 [Desulfobacterales bacterium]|jgi:hypothetical protein